MSSAAKTIFHPWTFWPAIFSGGSHNSLMPIALYATNNALLAHLPDLVENNTDEDMPLAILLTNNSETLAESVASAGLDIVTIPVQSARLGRLNFDMVGLIILDLTPAELLSSSGRRLSEILGRLAEDLLTLVLAGDGVTMTGAFLPDGVTAALNLVPRAVVMPQLQAGDELRALLAQLGEAGLRLTDPRWRRWRDICAHWRSRLGTRDGKRDADRLSSRCR